MVGAGGGRRVVDVGRGGKADRTNGSRPSSVYGGAQQMHSHHGDEGGMLLNIRRRMSSKAVLFAVSPDPMR